MNFYQTKFAEKLEEALKAVLPIIGLVLLLSFTIAPIPPSILLLFLFGAVLLVIGMMFFTLGAELAMTPMGEKVGTKMARSMKLQVVLFLCFLLGGLITVSEPDLQVLAEQVPSIPNHILILAVAFGVGFFLMVAMMRMLFSRSLPSLLIVCYILVFILAFFVPKDFLAVAFDSGGVTTGPMTVPFIMSMGVGFAAVRSDKHAEDDSFGLVALCSIGPILAVLLLGLLYHPDDAVYIPSELPVLQDSVELWQHFARGFPEYMGEIMVSLLPIALFFAAFQILSLRLKKKTLLKIIIGIAYTYIGLVLFLTGVNVGFMPAGPLDPDTDRYDHRIFYRQGRTCRLCTDGAGRRDHLGRYLRPFHGCQPLPWRLGFRRTCYHPRIDRRLYLLVYPSGIRNRHLPVILGT